MSFEEIEDWDALQPGDILLSLPWTKQKLPFATKAIMLAQSLYYAKEGYYPITHTAVYLGKRKHKQHLVAHVAESGYRLRIESLEEIAYQEQEERPFIVFRANHIKMQDKIAEEAWSVANSIKEQRKEIKWSLISAASCLFFRSFILPNEPKNLKKTDIDVVTHCSKFAAQCIQNAACEASPRHALPIYPEITPAGLFKALYTHGSFRRLHYFAGVDLYTELKNEIVKHLNRIQARKSHSASQKKWQTCHAALERSQTKWDFERASNLEKCFGMMQDLLPYLAEHTAFSFYKEAYSARELRSWSHKRGVFGKREVLNPLPQNDCLPTPR